MAKKKPKKNIPFNEIRTTINEMLGNENFSQEQKKILCMLYEKISMDSDNYNGFNYTKWAKEGGAKEWNRLVEDGKVRNDDFSRREAYIGPMYNRFYY